MKPRIPQGYWNYFCFGVKSHFWPPKASFPKNLDFATFSPNIHIIKAPNWNCICGNLSYSTRHNQSINQSKWSINQYKQSINQSCLLTCSECLTLHQYQSSVVFWCRELVHFLGICDSAQAVQDELTLLLQQRLCFIYWSLCKSS